MKRKELTIKCGMYMADLDYTLLQVAEEVGVSINVVYHLIMKYLPYMDYSLYERCRERMEEHKHWGRGGRKHEDMPV